MSDIAARLHARAAQQSLHVPDELGSKLAIYFDLLQRWNRKINLTSLLDVDDAVDRLLLEPIAAATYLPHGSSLADLGSGGGSPAIPLALALASPTLLMVESRSRKAAFLREVAGEVQLDAKVEATRFELACTQTAYVGRYDIASLRAVRPDVASLASAAALVRTGGLVALFESIRAQETPGILPPDLTWRGTQPLLGSLRSQLAMFHVEHP